MKIIRKSLLALLLGLSLTACGISRNKIINTEFTRATEAESQVSQFVSGTPSETTSFDYSMVPEYTGSASVAINNNVPFFNADEKAAGTSSFETYSELDDFFISFFYDKLKIYSCSFVFNIIAKWNSIRRANL